MLRLAANVRASDSPARADVDYFKREVEQLSGGKLRLHVIFQPEGDDPADTAFEPGIARAVRAGTFDLGWIGAPVWDELGVSSLRALQTPFLVTDYALLGRVVTSPLAGRMLSGLSRAGVVGLALVPAVLGHPIGFRQSFVRLSDYSGARVGDTPSRTTDAILRALGATPVHVTGSQSLQKGGVDANVSDVEGTEQTGSCSARCAWLIASTVTVNVTLFPSAETLFANPRALRRLTGDERAALRTAAARTVAHAASAPVSETAGVREFCKNDGHVVTATRDELATLERATRPVTAELERDPETAALIASIRRLKASTPPVAAASTPSGCVPARRRTTPSGQLLSPSILNGTYRYVLTKHDALTRGDPGDKTPRGLAQYPTVAEHTLRDGTWWGGNELNGTYTLTRDRLTFDWTAVGYALHFRYSRDRDGTLHLTAIPPMENGDRFWFSTERWQRIGPPLKKLP